MRCLAPCHGWGAASTRAAIHTPYLEEAGTLEGSCPGVLGVVPPPPPARPAMQGWPCLSAPVCSRARREWPGMRMWPHTCDCISAVQIVKLKEGQQAEWEGGDNRSFKVRVLGLVPCASMCTCV